MSNKCKRVDPEICPSVWLTLPEDIWIEIVDGLDWPDRLEITRLCSLLWKMSQTPLFWKTVQFSSHDLYNFYYTRYVKHVDYGQKEAYLWEHMICQQLPFIRFLDYTNTTYHDVGNKLLHFILTNFQHLRHLTLNCLHEIPGDYKIMYSFPSTLISIKLDYFNIFFVNNILAQCPPLITLCLQNCKMQSTKELIWSDLFRWPSLKTLETLDLSFSSKIFFRAFNEILSLPKLKRLIFMPDIDFSSELASLTSDQLSRLKQCSLSIDILCYFGDYGGKLNYIKKPHREKNQLIMGQKEIQHIEQFTQLYPNIQWNVYDIKDMVTKTEFVHHEYSVLDILNISWGSEVDHYYILRNENSH